MSCDTCGMANGACMCADEVETLRAQLAAVEKERDALSKDYAGLVSTYEKEVGTLAARVAQLEGALEPTAENIGAYYNVPANVSGSAWDDIVAVLAAIRARAGLGGKEGK